MNKIKTEINRIKEKLGITPYRATMVSLAIIGLMHVTSKFASDKQKDSLKNVNSTINIDDTKEEENKLNKTYKITDEESFKQLYEASLPLAQLSMFPTEVLVLNPYSDNGKPESNTIGLGSYWYPKNGDPYSSDWILTKEYIKKHGSFKLTGDDALKLSDGWCRYREGGRIYKSMYKKLKGCELKPHEFAAIFSRIYNNEKYGLEVCKYVHDNYENPLKCAYKIMCFKPGKNFENGIIKRDASEALLYLNYKDYAAKVGKLQVKEGINSKGHIYYVSSVTQLNHEDCYRMRDCLAKGDLSAADVVCRNITQYIPKGGRSVREIIYNEVENDQTRQDLLQFTSDAIDFIEVKIKNDYEIAIEKYNKGDYKESLEVLNSIIDKGFGSADIHNDIAITQYHLGNYDECIAESRLVLKTGESEFYPAAYFNAGKAYEQKGDSDRALANYKLAKDKRPDVKAYQKAVQRMTPKETKNIENKNKGFIENNQKKLKKQITKQTQIIQARKGSRNR